MSEPGETFIVHGVGSETSARSTNGENLPDSMKRQIAASGGLLTPSEIIQEREVNLNSLDGELYRLIGHGSEGQVILARELLEHLKSKISRKIRSTERLTGQDIGIAVDIAEVSIVQNKKAEKGLDVKFKVRIGDKLTEHEWVYTPSEGTTWLIKPTLLTESQMSLEEFKKYDWHW